MKAAAKHFVVLAYYLPVIVVTVRRVMIIFALITCREKEESVTSVKLQLLFDVVKVIIRVSLAPGHGPDALCRPGAGAGQTLHQSSHASQQPAAPVGKRLIDIDCHQ